MKSNQKPTNAPGAGTDKQHDVTPGDANDKFKKQDKENIQKNPGGQNAG